MRIKVIGIKKNYFMIISVKSDVWVNNDSCFSTSL